VREPSRTILRWYGDDMIEGAPLSPRKCVLKVPEGPGLGVTVDRKALQRRHERFLAEGVFAAGAPGQHYGGALRKH